MKTWIWIAVILLVVGLLLFVVSMSFNEWDYTRLSRIEMKTKTYVPSAPFTEIDIKATTAVIRILPAEDGACKVVCREYEKAGFAVKSENGRLTVTENDQRKWYDHIGFYFQMPTVTVYLPEKAYDFLSVEGKTGDVTVDDAFTFGQLQVAVKTGDIKCEASVMDKMTLSGGTGEIKVVSVKAGAVNLSLSTGDVHLQSLACDELTINGGTGDVEMEDVIVTGKMTVKNGTGDVEFERCDAQSVDIRTSTGDIEGSFLSGKMFDAKSSTGDINLPQSDRNGGDCYLKTSTGDIEIKIEN